jgi:hypothetical protein
VKLLEEQPERFDVEQTNLYAAMDYAYGQSNMAWILRIDELVDRIARAGDAAPLTNPTRLPRRGPEARRYRR